MVRATALPAVIAHDFPARCRRALDAPLGGELIAQPRRGFGAETDGLHAIIEARGRAADALAPRIACPHQLLADLLLAEVEVTGAVVLVVQGTDPRDRLPAFRCI